MKAGLFLHKEELIQEVYQQESVFACHVLRNGLLQQ